MGDSASPLGWKSDLDNSDNFVKLIYNSAEVVGVKLSDTNGTCGCSSMNVTYDGDEYTIETGNIVQTVLAEIANSNPDKAFNGAVVCKFHN